MTTFTTEQVNEMLNQLMSDPNRLEYLRKTLGVGVAHEKDKNKVLLDDYTFRRIDKFTGTEGTWPEWSFNVLMTVAQVDATIGDSLEEIKSKAVKPMTADMFKDCWSSRS